jgi:hypothetical protein
MTYDIYMITEKYIKNAKTTYAAWSRVLPNPLWRWSRKLQNNSWRFSVVRFHFEWDCWSALIYRWIQNDRPLIKNYTHCGSWILVILYPFLATREVRQDNMVRFLLKCSPGIKNLTSAMCVSFREGPIVLNSSVMHPKFRAAISDDVMHVLWG